MNVNVTVARDTVADFAINFDTCESFVKSGRSGRPVGARVVGDSHFVDEEHRLSRFFARRHRHDRIGAGCGVPMRQRRRIPAGASSSIPCRGAYDLVVAAPALNAVLTGVRSPRPAPRPSAAQLRASTLRCSTGNYTAFGTLSVNGSLMNTNGAVRATQNFTGGPVVETSYAGVDATTGRYSMTLPADAPVKVAYAAGATTFAFAGNVLDAGRYKLEANVPGFAVQPSEVTPMTNEANFSFPP